MMNINRGLLEELQGTASQILVVTKYFDADITESYIEKFQEFQNIVLGFGENRITQIVEKNLPREDIHFIGNIQSKEIKKIVEYCSYIHSVGSKKHFLKIMHQALSQKRSVKIFLQIQLDSEKNIGFLEEEIVDILGGKNENNFVEIIGISGMGAGEFTREEKRDEFQYLVDIRDRYIPKGKISAGTSRDYEIAMEMNIDIIRIGKKLFV